MKVELQTWLKVVQNLKPQVVNPNHEIFCLSIDLLPKISIVGKFWNLSDLVTAYSLFSAKRKDTYHLLWNFLSSIIKKVNSLSQL